MTAITTTTPAAPPREGSGGPSSCAGELAALIEEISRFAGAEPNKPQFRPTISPYVNPAIATLEALSAAEALDDERRSDFLVAAGDILVQHYGNSVAARTLFDRGRVLRPKNPSLWHVTESSQV